MRLAHVKTNKPEEKAQFTYIQINEEEQMELFKHKLSQIEWSNIKTLHNPNISHKSFLYYYIFDIFFKIYEKIFFLNLELK